MVIPTFNRWALLRRALASALAQRDVRLEVIVVDDGSRDGTTERLAQVQDDRLRVLVNDANQGVAHARNRGVAAARAPWVAFLDDDDFWAPTRLREHRDAAHRTDAHWTFGSFLTFTEAGAIRSVSRAPLPADLAVGLYRLNLVGTPSTVTVRTEIVRSAGGFDPRLSVLADWDLWLRLKDLGPAVAVEEPLLAYAAHAENMQRTTWSVVPGEFGYIAEKHAAGARAAGVRFGGEAWDRWTAETHRRMGRRLAASKGLLEVGLRHRSPVDVLRALILPLGEGAMALASHHKQRRGAQLPPTPDWLLEGLEACPPMSPPGEMPNARRLSKTVERP